MDLMVFVSRPPGDAQEDNESIAADTCPCQLPPVSGAGARFTQVGLLQKIEQELLVTHFSSEVMDYALPLRHDMIDAIVLAIACNTADVIWKRDIIAHFTDVHCHFEGIWRRCWDQVMVLHIHDII